MSTVSINESLFHDIKILCSLDSWGIALINLDYQKQLIVWNFEK